MMDNFSPADMKAVMDNNDWGQGGSWWVIVLFILLFGGGNWGYNRGNDFATTGDVERGFYQQTLQTKLDGNTYGIADATYALNNAIKEGAYGNTMATKDAQYAVTEAVGAVGSQLAQCCCENKTLQLQNKYELANAIHAEGEATRALIQENKIETLQGKINQLELQAALCGVVRYPMSASYSVANNPYFGNCGCNGYGYGTAF